MCKFEKTICNLRHHIEEEKKCYETLVEQPLNDFMDEHTRAMMKRLLLGKSIEIACLDQLLASNSSCPAS